MYSITPQEPSFTDPKFGENTSAKYEKLEKLGNGVYGIVYKARDKERNDIVALKRMLFELNDYFFWSVFIYLNSKKIESEGVPTHALREISLLREIQHPNVVA